MAGRGADGREKSADFLKSDSTNKLLKMLARNVYFIAHFRVPEMYHQEDFKESNSLKRTGDLP
jgi:hypothetical protein